jgi:hypothetical protein
MIVALFALATLGVPPEPVADPPIAVTQPLHDAVTQAIRNCPQTKGDEIAVCAHDRGFAEKYRIQRLDRPSMPASDPKIQLSGVGSDAPGGCSNLGQVGAIGCSKRDYDAWAAWKRQQQAAARGGP